MKIKESLNVTFDEIPPPSKTSPLVDDDLDEVEGIRVSEKKNLENDIEDETLEIDELVNIKESRNHQLENVIGNRNQRTLRYGSVKNHKKTSQKNGQARTRESEEYKAEARKVKPQSKSAKKNQKYISSNQAIPVVTFS
ncbi:hypothetical protein Tco_0451980 [Tanacetum coccineum]